VNDSLERLIAALEQQTAAINKLAESNMALVSIVVDGDAAEAPAVDEVRYMDGSVVRVPS